MGMVCSSSRGAVLTSPLEPHILAASPLGKAQDHLSGREVLQIMPELPQVRQGDAVGGVCMSGEAGLTESQASTQSHGHFQEPGYEQWEWE